MQHSALQHVCQGVAATGWDRPVWMLVHCSPTALAFDTAALVMAWPRARRGQVIAAGTAPAQRPAQLVCQSVSVLLRPGTCMSVCWFNVPTALPLAVSDVAMGWPGMAPPAAVHLSRCLLSTMCYNQASQVNQSELAINKLLHTPCAHLEFCESGKTGQLASGVNNVLPLTHPPQRLCCLTPSQSHRFDSQPRPCAPG